MEGICLLANDLHVTVTDSDADITVTVYKVTANGLHINLANDQATIVYGGGKSRFFRGLATLVGWISDGITEKSDHFTPAFSLDGSMIDMSRNAVMNVGTVKLMLRKMALLGMNAFMLYTEDTYEITERPYWGHMRGRYTEKEIKELDEYALTLGIELIPCVQTLGHLSQALRWPITAPYRDTNDVLLVGAKETYLLIDDIIRTIANTFTSKRIHIGCDETHTLGTGQSLDKNGYRLREELFLEHLNKVAAIAQKYGLQPMMWSDMFFRMSGKGLEGLRDYDVRIQLRDDIANFVPKNIQQVFWDYYTPDEAFYSTTIDKHRQLGTKTLFAGGVWTWSGHCPFFSRSIKHTVPALDACRKKAIREVLATVWHNGSECSLILSLAGLALYADYDYCGCYNEESIARSFRYATGESYYDFLKLEMPEHPNEAVVACTRALLYNDPLIGLVDAHVEKIETAEYYKQLLEKLSPLGAEYAPAFETIRALTDLLINKADFGVRLTRAYREKNRNTLSLMKEECDVVIEKIRKLRAQHRTSWMQYNKPFGWEIHDIRYAGLMARFETTRDRIADYLSGTIDAIEELEAERLRFDGLDSNADPFNKKFLWYSYSSYVSACRL